MFSYASISLGIIFAQMGWQINYLWITFAICVIIFYLIFCKNQNIFFYLRAILILLCAYSYADYRIQHKLNNLITYPISHLQLIGYFTTPAINFSEQETASAEFKITEGYYTGKKILLFYPGKTSFAPQQIYQLEVNLSPLSLTKNIAAFDYRQYLIAQNIVANGYLVNIVGKQKLSYAPQALINLLRSNTINYMYKILHSYEYASMAIALATGYQKLITPEQWLTFKNNGIAHIISVSGLPLIFLSLICSVLVNTFYSFLPIYKYPQQTLITIAIVIFSFLYAILTGFAIPNQRAFYLIVITAYLTIQRNHLPLLQKLSLVLAIILIIDPFACVSYGFWLTFILVANIFIVNTLFANEKSRLKQWIRMQVSIFLTSLPISLYFFKTFPFINIISNLWAIPILGSVMTPLILLLTLFHCASLLSYSVIALKYIMYPLEYLAQIPSYWQSGPDLITILFSYLGLIILILPMAIKGKNILGLTLFAIFFASSNKNQFGYGIARHIVFADHSLGIVITETTKHTVLTLIATESGNFKQQLQYTLIPYLLNKHTKKIDNIICNQNIESAVTTVFSQNQILLGEINAKINHDLSYDGVNIKIFHNLTHIALQIEDLLHHQTYIGNGYYPFTFFNWNNLILTGIENNIAWVFNTKATNLILNYPNNMRPYINQLVDNLNLPISAIYDLPVIGSVTLQGETIIEAVY